MEGVSTPPRFVKWSAIFAIGSAVRRRVFMQLISGRNIYPNLFVWLVGPPGTGKTEAIVPMGETLRKSGTSKMAPNDVSKQSLLDVLAKAKDAVTFEGPPAELIDYHYMAIVIRELSNFMAQYDTQLAGILTDIFDNPPVNSESKRSGAGTDIVRPSLSFIAGTATKNLGATIGKDLWGQGFMSRVIMVYAAEQPEVVLFGEEDGPRRAETNPILVSFLNRIGMMKGRMVWDKEAQNAFKDWFGDGPGKGGTKPYPIHPKLQEYNARRHLHICKLTMISALSDGRMNIILEDFQRAKGWLEEAEFYMPEIFKEMGSHSDGEVLRELHMAMWVEHRRTSKPVPAMFLYNFLSQKVAARDIPRLIEVGEASGLYARMAGTQGTDARYKPVLHSGEIGD